MILGNQVEWALHCVVVLANCPEGKLLSSKALADYHGVPKEYLSKSLQMLSQAGLVQTTTGPRGGYSLARPASKISFLDVIEAVEGNAKSFRCMEIRKNNPCLAKQDRRFSNLCQIASVMFEADETWRDFLRHRMVSEIVKKISDGISKETAQNLSNWYERN